MDESSCPFADLARPTTGYFKHRHRGQPPCRECTNLFVAHNAAYRKSHGRKDYSPVSHTERPCLFCQQPFTPKRKDGRYCSRRCADRAWLGWSSSLDVELHAPFCDLPEGHPARRPESPGTWWTFLVSGPCAHCGEPFTGLAADPDGPPRYCSQRCLRAHNGARRRARKVGAYVADVRRRDIFERDGWRCQLCGKSVNRKAKAPHPKSPVIDHIIPLARGGTHEPSNVQCAHFRCNSLKSDGAANDQLRLIG